MASSKVLLLVGLAFAIFVLITSEVTARELAQTTQTQKEVGTNIGVQESGPGGSGGRGVAGDGNGRHVEDDNNGNDNGDDNNGDDEDDNDGDDSGDDNDGDDDGDDNHPDGPDPIQLDFCIPDTETQCKNSSSTTVEDFIFSGIKSPGKSSEIGMAANTVTSKAFPGLNTLGMAFVRADFDVGGINPPHFHPRATEIAFVLEGSVYSGFVDTQNKIFAKVIEKGEVMVFPRGVIHFQLNVGHTKATILGSFNSENPGLQRIPNAVFGSGIEGELLEKAFGLSLREVSRLRQRFSPKH